MISTHLRGGKTIVHVLADTRPGASFDGVDPDLEDVYFVKLSGNGNAGGKTSSQGGR